MNMRQIILDGRIGKGGAKVLKTSTGKEYVRFSLANDAYVDGTTKTDWFDVTCFDPYVVSKKSEYLKQGRYAIVQGSLKGEIAIKNGTAYLNYYITATNIELPSFGSKKEESGEVQVSTFTGGTKSAEIAKTTEMETKQAEPQPMQAPQPQPAVSQAAPAGWNSDDDLPF